MLKRTERLKGVDPRLVAVVEAASKSVPFDILVVEGLRTLERQKQLYAQGRTTPGKIVTWTLKSKHIDGKAVDIVPLKKDGTIDWNDVKSFDQLASAMVEASHQVKIKVRSGADWDGDGKYREKGEFDSPHWETD
jgi:hypothetical protein